jgi:dienelactone hydrolase
MHIETLTYEADGVVMKSQLYVEAGNTGKRPGVLVFPEAGGLSAHAKSRAEKLAGLGYVALACDYYGEGKLFTDMSEVMAVLGPLRENPAHIRARAQAALAALTARPETDATRIAAIGYCFGGTTALELARSGADIKGAIGFHSGLQTTQPEDAKNITAKILVCLGADDPMIDPAQRDAFIKEMNDGKVDWQMHLYGGVVHSFTNEDAEKMNMPNAVRYDAKADTRSWASMLDMFKEIFK